MHSLLDQLASASGSASQQPNIALAATIARTGDTQAVAVLIGGLDHKQKAIRHDCIKTLYETAALAPALCASHTDRLLALLHDKDNRLQWGAMTALSAIAHLEPAKMFASLDRIIDTAGKGSVITRDHCVKILCTLSGMPQYAGSTLPLLFAQIQQAPVNQVPAYAEQALPVVTPQHAARFRQILQQRLEDIDQAPKRKRVEKVLKKLAG